MLRVYRAPDRIPGEMTLLADEGTWEAVIATLKQGSDHATVLQLTAALQAAGAGSIGRRRLPAAQLLAGTGPVRRVTLPDTLARTVLAAVETAR